jgi:hypothetical protein
MGVKGVRGSTFSDLRKSFVSESNISLTPGLRTMDEMGRLCRESVHLQHPWESAKYICILCTASASYSFLAWRTSCLRIELFLATTLKKGKARNVVKRTGRGHMSESPE